MPEPEEYSSGPLEVVRSSSNRPIIIYQGAPPGALEPSTSNALALLSWLALMTVCLATILFCLWQVWNPGFDRSQFSPIYAEGRPLGLAKQIEERAEINARADGLAAFRDHLWASNSTGSRPSIAHPLMSDRNGIDDVRRQWDAMCNAIRARLYDRRLAEIDARSAELRRRRAAAPDPAARAQFDSDLRALQLLRSDQLERRRTDTDPALRCVPAAESPVCSDSDDAPWCNPDILRPGEFLEEASSRR